MSQNVVKLVQYVALLTLKRKKNPAYILDFFSNTFSHSVFYAGKNTYFSARQKKKHDIYESIIASGCYHNIILSPWKYRLTTPRDTIKNKIKYAKTKISKKKIPEIFFTTLWVRAGEKYPQQKHHPHVRETRPLARKTD